MKQFIMICIIGLIISHILLIDLDPSQMNFWVDYSNLFYLPDFPMKDSFSWNENLLWVYQYYTFFEIPDRIYNYVCSVIFWHYSSYFVLYFIFVAISILSGLMVRLIFSDHWVAKYLMIPIVVFCPPILYTLYATETITFLLWIIGILWFFTCLEYYKKSKNKRYLLLIIPISLFISHPLLFFFFFITYNVIFIQEKIRKSFLLVFNVSIGLIHVFWIIPFLLSFLVNRDLGMAGYTQALVLNFSQNSLLPYSFLFLWKSYKFLFEFYGNFWYVHLVWYYLLWASLIFCIFIKRNVHRGSLLYIFILTLLLLGFSVGPRGDIWYIYSYLFEKYGFFSFFRSYHNVFLILAFIFFWILFNVASKNRTLYKILIVYWLITIFGFYFFSSKSFTERSSDLPNAYFEIKNIIDKDSTDGKVLLMPKSVYDYYVWDKPRNDKYFLETFFNHKWVIFSRSTFDIPKITSLFSDIYDNRITDINRTPLSIQYVLFRKDLRDTNYYTQYNGDMSIFWDKIYSSEFVDLYKVRNSIATLLWKNNILFSKVNSTQYNVTVNLWSSNNNLKLLQSFHPEWKLYIEPYSPLDCMSVETYTGTNIDSNSSKSLSHVGTGTISSATLLQEQEMEPSVLSAMKLKTLGATSFLAEIQKLFPAKIEAPAPKEPSYHTTECKPQNIFYAGWELSKLWQKTIFDDTHKLVYDYANEWTIDPKYIKKNYSKEYYKQNPDGSIDVRMTLYFKPQSYFYLGLGISWITFVLLMVYLGWNVVKRRKTSTIVNQ